MAIFSAEMLTLERGDLPGFRADELVVGRSARAALGEPFGDPALATRQSTGEPYLGNIVIYRWSCFGNTQVYR